jgi:hypothetical protein
MANLWQVYRVSGNMVGISETSARAQRLHEAEKESVWIMSNRRMMSIEFYQLIEGAARLNMPGFVGSIATYEGNRVVYKDNGDIVLFESCEYCGQSELDGQFCAKCGAPVWQSSISVTKRGRCTMPIAGDYLTNIVQRAAFVPNQEGKVKMEQKFSLVKFGVMQKIDNAFINPNVEIERILKDFHIVVTGRLLAQRSLKHYEVKYPQDWWQAFKERWFPRALLSISPVVYREVIIDVDAVYPELHKKMHLPNEEHFLTISRYDV